MTAPVPRKVSAGGDADQTPGGSGSPSGLPTPPAAPTPADTVHEYLGRFIAYPSPAAHIAHTLWVLHAHLMEHWSSTPRIAFLSPEPGSGKTRALEATEPLVPFPVEAVNVTPAYLFRKVGDEDGAPTVLFDEIDTVFGPKARENEELRGLLNAGHRKGAVAGRCVVKGKLVTTEEIPAYCAVALAGLGGLPATLLSRSIVIRMRRRAPGERVEPFRRRIHGPQGEAIRDAIAAWSASFTFPGWPTMPDGVEDRDADLWEALLTIGDSLGGPWPTLARSACSTLVAEAHHSTPSLGIRLLADLRIVFGDLDQLSTEDALRGLCELDEAPWGELYGGKPMNARGLARRLGQYGIGSTKLRVGDSTPRGYRRADLWDAWLRYLPAAAGTEQTEHAEHVPDVPDVPADQPKARRLRDRNPQHCAMKIHLDPGAAVTGPPWRCSCGQQLEAGEIDGHLLDHVRQKLETIDGPPPPPTLARWLQWRWARLRAWWQR